MKALIILFLVVGIFGSAAYFTYDLFFRPQQQLAEEKQAPPPPPPPDPTLPDFEKCVALQEAGDLIAARTAFEEFIEDFPHSSKVEDAKDRLGAINTDLFLSTKPAPEKQVYVVKSGDVLNRVASRNKTTPELIMRANNLTGTMLKIGQKLMISPSEFSIVINRSDNKVTLYNKGRFFKQYHVRTMPERLTAARKGSAAPAKVTGRVTDKIAWSEAGGRVIFSEKEYANASHWIVFNVAGHTLYSDPGQDSEGKAHKPPTGIGLAPEDMEELAAMLSKGNPVTIE